VCVRVCAYVCVCVTSNNAGRDGNACVRVYM